MVCNFFLISYSLFTYGNLRIWTLLTLPLNLLLKHLNPRQWVTNLRKYRAMGTIPHFRLQRFRLQHLKRIRWHYYYYLFIIQSNISFQDPQPSGSSTSPKSKKTQSSTKVSPHMPIPFKIYLHTHFPEGKKEKRDITYCEFFFQLIYTCPPDSIIFPPAGITSYFFSPNHTN